MRASNVTWLFPFAMLAGSCALSSMRVEVSEDAAVGGIGNSAGTGFGGVSTGNSRTVTGGTGVTGGSNATGAGGGLVATGGVFQNGGASASGGTTSDISGTGGLTSAGGGVHATGGSANTGGASATTGGAFAAGGTKATGGAPTTGGTPSTAGGNNSTGGRATGGAAAGGAATGGVVTGGAAAGGVATGGRTPTGGAATGGVATGGNAPTGGSATGGVATGGSSQTPSCPSPALTTGDSTQTVMVGALTRNYILHVPSAYQGTAAVPLIVDFHPFGGTATAEAAASPFKAVTDPEGVITAYPQGETGPAGAAWDVGPCCTSLINGAAVDDVAFAKALVAQVETKACIDTSRVYAVGFSMGGGMSHYLACHAANLFAAVVPQAFDLLAENQDSCTPTRPIPVLSFRGANDTVAIYGGGYTAVVTSMPITLLGAQNSWVKWASIDACTDSPVAPTVNGTTWQCSYYKQCAANVQVGLCINTGGHAYGDGTIGWTFLKQFTLP